MSEIYELALLVAGKLKGIVGNAKFVNTMLYNSAFVVAMEAATARRWRRYLTPVFLTDLSYLLFFAAGMYYFFISGPIQRAAIAAVNAVAPWWMELNLLGVFPGIVHSIIVVLAIDLIEYALHRVGHSNRFYWKFHCIHHTAAELTPFTKFRVHWLDMTVFGTVKFLPMMALGMPATLWMPILPLGFLQILSHFDLPWTYGPLGRFLVSPGFHRMHHSADPAQCHTNFGIIFSCWDYIFGTAAAKVEAPVAYGLPPGSDPVPEGFVRQFFYPFFLVAGELGLLRRPPRQQEWEPGATAP
jgi:sterol desaturase/sphingolipid hydroxylase (fatty acid hydroxylase superfamily)